MASSLVLFLFTLLALSSSCCLAISSQNNRTVLALASRIGINYGRLGDNLPSPYQSINLIKSIKAGHVKLYDADPETLTLLSNTNLYVTIMVPNDQIISIGADQAASDNWIANNVLLHNLSSLRSSIWFKSPYRPNNI